MITHFSIHKSIGIILQDSEKLIYALKDIKDYFENLEEGFKKMKYFRFLRKKFDKIYTIIFAERSGNLTDEKGNLQSEFNLKDEFGEDFYNSVQDFFELMYVSDDNLINSEAFGLWIYMLYLTFSLASEDAKNTTEEILEFEISERKLERASYFFEKDFDRDIIAYYLFLYQLENILHSKNMEQWKKLPVSVIIKLHNGDFDSVPKYVQKINGIMQDAKLILEYKKQAEKNNDFSENAIAEWKETAKDSDFYKRLSDFSFGGNNYSYEYFGRDADAVSIEEKIITINGIRQKVYSEKYRNFKVELSAVLNEETDEFEIYLGKKTSDSQKPLFYFTRFRRSFALFGGNGRNRIIPALRVLNGIEIDKTINNLIDSFIKNFADAYFSKCNFAESENCLTLEELSEKITELEKKRKEEIKIEEYKLLEERKNKNDYELHNDRLTELHEKERFAVYSNFRKGDEHMEPFITLSIYNYPTNFNFQLIISEDKKSLLVFKDINYGEAFSKHEPLFAISVSAYETLLDFAFEFLKALTDKKNEINYDSDIPEIEEIKKTHSEYLQNQFKKNLEEHKSSVIERENEQNRMFVFPASANDEKQQIEDEFIKNFADDYFSKRSFSQSEASITLKEFYEKITDFEKNRKDKIKIEEDKLCEERKSKNDYELHTERLSELYEKENFSVSIDFQYGYTGENHYINLSISGYSTNFKFQLIISDDKKSVLVFKDIEYRESFSKHEPLFAIPVSAYEALFDFATKFLKALSDEREFNYFEKKVKEAVGKIQRNKYWSPSDLQQEIDEMEKNGYVVEKDCFNNVEDVVAGQQFNIEDVKMEDYKYKIEGYKFCLTSFYEDDEKNYTQKIQNELKLFPAGDGSYLEIKFYDYIYDGNVLSTVKIPSCQYKKIFDFIRRLRNYWEENHAAYYEKIEHTDDFGNRWLEEKPNYEEIKRAFEKLVAESFDLTEYDHSVKFTPLELYKTMKSIEIEKKSPLCFANKKEINA